MDLIKREDAVKALERAVTFEGGKKEMTIREVFADIPSVEPKKGEWMIGDPWPHNVYCSKCYKTFAQRDWAVWLDGTLPRNFCPNCGARMK